jgi:cytochrome c
MDSLYVNKAVAAALTAGIAFFVTGLLGDELIRAPAPSKPAIAVALPEPAAPAGEQKTGPDPIAPLMASADPAAGLAYTKTICVACHSFNEGGKAGVGPNLYGILGAPHAHMAGFDYSKALKAKTGPWTYEALNEWLYKPAAYAPGTRMSFAGIPSDKTRANVIAYLRSLSPNPEPLPTPTAAPAKTAMAAPAAAGGVEALAQKEGLPPLEPLLAKADPEAGHAFTKTICVACHSFNKDGKAGVGPNLWGVVGAPHGHMEGFNYSTALKGKQGPWTYAELNEWLYKPSAYAPGTRMSYAGLPNAQMRANVIDYLRTLSDHPEPLPTDAGSKPASAGEAPVAGAPQAAGGDTGKGAPPPPPMANQGGPAAGASAPAAKSP